MTSRDKDFADKFNKIVVGFEYSRGYSNCDGSLFIKCMECGAETKRSGGFLRKVIRGEKNIVCSQCNNDSHSNIHKETTLKECNNCSKVFETNSGHSYCSEYCLNYNKNRRKENKKTKIYKELKAKGVYDSSITLDKLLERKGTICYLCGKETKLDVDKNDNLYPSIKHVQPLTKQGAHTWDNVKVAHRICNSTKADRVL